MISSYLVVIVLKYPIAIGNFTIICVKNTSDLQSLGRQEHLDYSSEKQNQNYYLYGHLLKVIKRNLQVVLEA